MNTRHKSADYLTDEFPTPDDLPNAEILIFDGNCAFCQGKVRTLRRFLGDRLAFLSLHDPEVERRFPDLTYDRLMSEMVLIDHQGRRRGGAAAVQYLSRKTVWLWPIAIFLHIPFTLPLWQRIYQWIAVRRYRLGGKLNASVPSKPEDGSGVEAEEQQEQVCEDVCSIHLNK